MVQFLQRSPSFGQVMAQDIGQGLSKGTDFLQQLALEKFKKDQRRQLVQDIEQGPMSPMAGFDQKIQEERNIQSPAQNSQRKARAYAVAGEHELARQTMEEAKLERKEESEKKTRHYDVAKKSLEHASELAQQLPQKEAALESMKDAISSNNLSYFSPDNLAELTGIDAFRSPEGAAFKTASKEFFLGNTLRVGSKGLNQWFEKQVLEMGPKIGRSTPANLAVTEMLDMEMDIQRKEVELTNKIADEMENKPGGYIRRDLSQKVQGELSKYAIERQKEAKSAIEEIKERYEPVNKSGHLMRDPSGNLRRVGAKDYKAAKQAGYTVAG